MMASQLLMPNNLSSLEDATFVVFDVETTGLSTAYDTIIEFAAVKIKEGQVIDKFERFANPHSNR